MELSVNKIVKSLVTNDVFLATSLNRGYINLSAVARDLKPGIEKKLGEEVNADAIISALKRNRDLSRTFDVKVIDALSKTSIQLLTSVTKFVTYTNKNDIVVRGTFDLNLQGSIYISTGAEYTTLVVEDRNLPKFNSLMKKGMVDRKSGLAVIVLKSPISMLDAPGFLMSIYSKLAFSGINIEETTNSYTDAIIIVDEKDSSDALSALYELIEFARGSGKK